MGLPMIVHDVAVVLYTLRIMSLFMTSWVVPMLCILPGRSMTSSLSAYFADTFRSWEIMMTVTPIFLDKDLRNDDT